MHLLNLRLAHSIYFQIVLIIILMIKVNEFVVPSFFGPGDGGLRYIRKKWLYY